MRHLDRMAQKRSSRRSRRSRSSRSGRRYGDASPAARAGGYVSWGPTTVHKLRTKSETTCGLKVPSAAKVGAVGFYDDYPEQHAHFCRRCAAHLRHRPGFWLDATTSGVFVVRGSKAHPTILAGPFTAPNARRWLASHQPKHGDSRGGQRTTCCNAGVVESGRPPFGLRCAECDAPVVERSSRPARSRSRNPKTECCAAGIVESGRSPFGQRCGECNAPVTEQGART
jgi:hypothetical protein